MRNISKSRRLTRPAAHVWGENVDLPLLLQHNPLSTRRVRLLTASAAVLTTPPLVGNPMATY